MRRLPALLLLLAPGLLAVVPTASGGMDTPGTPIATGSVGMGAQFHAAAAALYEAALTSKDGGGAGQDAPTAAKVEAAAINGLIHSGTTLLRGGHIEGGLGALNAVLRTRFARERPLPQPLTRAMLAKLHGLQVWYAINADEGPEPPGYAGEESLPAAASAPYWLDWPQQWEEGRGPVTQASGCPAHDSAARVHAAVSHLSQFAADIAVYHHKDCYVGFHGAIVQARDAHTADDAAGQNQQLGLLQHPSAPETTSSLLTLLALDLVPPDFEPQAAQGGGWPFWVPLQTGTVAADLTPAAVLQRATELIHRLRHSHDAADATTGEADRTSEAGSSSSGTLLFGEMSRSELERAMLWQSADELRHAERQLHPLRRGADTGGGQSTNHSSSSGSEKPAAVKVVRVKRLISLLGGYALNYFHFVTELLPGLLRLLPGLPFDQSSASDTGYRMQGGADGAASQDGAAHSGTGEAPTATEGQEEQEEVMILAHGGVSWTKQLLETILGIPRHRIIYSSPSPSSYSAAGTVGETGTAGEQATSTAGADGAAVVYHAEELLSWSLENPLSPHLLELTRRALLSGLAAALYRGGESGHDEADPSPSTPTQTVDDARRSPMNQCRCCTNTLGAEDAQEEGQEEEKEERLLLLLDRRECDRSRDDSSTASSGCRRHRPAVRGRSIVNHEEVLATLQRTLGSAADTSRSVRWRVCNVGDSGGGLCSVPEQLRCFQAANIVIGVEGAGLTNALVMPRRAHQNGSPPGQQQQLGRSAVINLHPAHPDARFSTLVSECGQSYFWQLAAGAGHSYLAYMLPNFTFSDDVARGLGGEANRVDTAELARFLRSEEFGGLLAY